MKVSPTEIAEVLLIEPKVYRDDRGFFLETFQEKRFHEAGITCNFVQDNHARSVRGTLRGLHYQSHPGQAKLIRATRGKVWDVAVDIRPGSPSFGRWTASELSEDNMRMLFVPVGFAHGYAVLSAVAEVQYKCSHFYLPDAEAGIQWDDPDIAVPWPLDDPILSDRDCKNPTLRQAFPQGFK